MCHFFVLTAFCCHPWSTGIIEYYWGHTAKWNVFVKICWNSAVTFCLTYKVAAHNFCVLLLMRFSMRTGIEKKKKTCWYGNHFIWSMLPLSEQSVFTVLVFCKKFMLEKVTMQRTLQFADVSFFFWKNPVKCIAYVVSKKLQLNTE